MPGKGVNRLPLPCPLLRLAHPSCPRLSLPADASERALAAELRGIGVGVQEIPEWKKQALGKAPTFGIRDTRSIKDQRESLPIYKLREQLVQAVQDNQVRPGGGRALQRGRPRWLPARIPERFPLPRQALSRSPADKRVECGR